MSDNGQTSITRADLEREIRHLRELLDASTLEKDKALRLQGLEYERRLELLNNAHERAEKAVQLTVPRDLYETHVNEFHHFREEVSTEFAKLKAISTSNTRFFTIITVMLSLLFSALSIWLRTK